MEIFVDIFFRLYAGYTFLLCVFFCRPQTVTWMLFLSFSVSLFRLELIVPTHQLDTF